MEKLQKNELFNKHGKVPYIWKKYLKTYYKKPLTTCFTVYFDLFGVSFKKHFECADFLDGDIYKLIWTSLPWNKP